MNVYYRITIKIKDDKPLESAYELFDLYKKYFKTSELDSYINQLNMVNGKLMWIDGKNFEQISIVIRNLAPYMRRKFKNELTEKGYIWHMEKVKNMID